MKKQLLFIAAFCTQINVLFAGMSMCVAKSNNSSGDNIVLNRTFSKAQQAAITITQTDLQTAYAFGNLRITKVAFTPSQANIGPMDLTTAQTWTIPPHTFTQTDTAIVINPGNTPYFSSFPGSQIAIEEYRRTCLNCDNYEYYSFSSGGVYLNGLANYLKTGPNTFDMEIDTTNFLLSTLPVSANTNFIVNDTIEQFDTTVFVSGYIRTEGYGSIIASDGSSHQVLKTIIAFAENENGNIKHKKMVNFVSNDGYDLILFLSDTTVTNGIAQVQEMDEIYLKPKVATGITETNTSGKLLAVYPNPATNVLTIENANGTNIFVTDILGKVVLDFPVNLTGSTTIHLDNIQSGLYTIKTGNQQTKFIKQN